MFQTVHSSRFVYDHHVMTPKTTAHRLHLAAGCAGFGPARSTAKPLEQQCRRSKHVELEMPGLALLACHPGLPVRRKSMPSTAHSWRQGFVAYTSPKFWGTSKVPKRKCVFGQGALQQQNMLAKRVVSGFHVRVTTDAHWGVFNAEVPRWFLKKYSHP